MSPFEKGFQLDDEIDRETEKNIRKWDSYASGSQRSYQGAMVNLRRVVRMYRGIKKAWQNFKKGLSTKVQEEEND